MEVRDKAPRQLLHFDAGRLGAANYFWSEIDNVNSLAGNDRDGWTGAFRLGIWRACSEKNHTSILRETKRERE